ncbi:glycosyl hydrolase [Gallaecimonas mangrovi]|uniref:glycosyl hydrolase n=1 Tax=Gallaecimonas mangrovi TaxID=2291597 RepID=UPI000E20A875|nr:glycosyl hydrolase [Gallaecimonas mangrovi]
MRLLVLLFVFLFSWPAFSDDALSEKRGLGSTNTEAADLALMSGKIAWWYNWSALPGNYVGSDYSQYGVEFVPMVWGTSLDENALRNYLSIHPEVKYILGFNEPNSAGEADLTPQQAADNWYKIENIADEFNLKIVAPAVNYSAGGVDIPGTDDDGNPFAYLDAFFADCSDCRVDYIAVHAYMSDPSYVEQYLAQFYSRYGKPIWLTEFNLSKGDNTETIEQQMDFLAEMTRWLENQSYIFRYAWFIGRTSGGASAAPYVDILGDAGQWTALGTLYGGIPGPDYRFDLPMTIQAEHAHSISGFHHRVTTDTNGNPVVQLFSDAVGATMQFHVHSDSEKAYNWTLNYASGGDAQIAIQVDDDAWQTVTLPDTGMQYFWSTITQAVTIPAGDHWFRVKVTSGTPNFDWMTFSD